MSYLQWNHNHEYFLVLVWKDMFDERPTGSDEYYCDEQHRTL